jgi:hypothetical protein
MNAAFVVILATAVFGFLLNTAGAEDVGLISKLAAIAAGAFCGAILCVPKRFAFAAPLFSPAISDVLINALYGNSDLFHRHAFQSRGGAEGRNRHLLLNHTTD